jgi:two-component system chemotaxis response regulator CheY
MTTALLPNLHPKILVVDPDPDAQALYAHMLGLADREITHASDGRDALAKAFDYSYPLIITETHLPFIDGYALCEIIRKDPTTRATPIMVVTSDTRPVSVTRALQAGADVVLTKPCAADSVLAEAQRLIVRSGEIRDHSRMLRDRGTAQVDRATALVARSANPKPFRKNRAHARFATSAPSLTPPALRCPSCDRSLTYEQSHIGGVSGREPEQWDYYACPMGCGQFQHRQRTRKIRPV